MIKEIIQLSLILARIDHGPFLVHLFQGLFHVFVKTHSLKKPVQEAVQKESGLMIKYIRI
jgi:hypothetical protein